MSESEAVLNARRRREQISEELAEIEVFLRLYQKYSGADVDEVDESIDPNMGIPQRDFVSLAHSILVAHGRPLTSKQLLIKLKEHGIPIGGADELKNLTTKLWRGRDSIERLDSGAYWPRNARHS